jgi:SAM-dependent methyltransferase
MLADTIATAKLALKVRRHGSSSLNALVSQVEASADSAAIARLADRVAPVYREDPTSAAKYAKPRHWLLLNTLRAADLGLHNASGLSILDIGCGPGYFLALARALGHDCYGVDAPDSYLTAVERDVYTTLTEAFGCRDFVSPLLIERFQPLPFRAQPFDLITAFWICFNRHRQPDEWGVEEWRFFVEDAMACLRPGGRLVLHLNENAERYGELRFYDAALRDYFCSVGSADNGRVAIARP